MRELEFRPSWCDLEPVALKLSEPLGNLETSWRIKPPASLGRHEAEMMGRSLWTASREDAQWLHDGFLLWHLSDAFSGWGVGVILEMDASWFAELSPPTGWSCLTLTSSSLTLARVLSSRGFSWLLSHLLNIKYVPYFFCKNTFLGDAKTDENTSLVFSQARQCLACVQQHLCGQFIAGLKF